MAGGVAALSGIQPGFAEESGAVAMEWGTPYIEASRSMSERFGKLAVNFVPYEGSAAGVLAKIKATWPNPPFDFVDNWSAVFPALIREGWAQTVSVTDVPNLADVPEQLIAKDDKGNWKSIPRSKSGAGWGYAKGKSPIEIKKIDDLFSSNLKGQIALPGPTQNSGLHIVSLALAFGGNERNIDPGFKALADLAKTGNVGRVYNVFSEGVASITSGETSVTFTDASSLNTIAASVPFIPVAQTDSSMKVFLWTEGWVVLASSKKKKEIFDLLNFSISPAEARAFNSAIKASAANAKAGPIEGLSWLDIQGDESFKKFAYVPDFDYLSAQGDAWAKRFEAEIMPLLR
ncbi:MAG: extracellular solute-binding protein [Pseudomonadota bacterium]